MGWDKRAAPNGSPTSYLPAEYLLPSSVFSSALPSSKSTRSCRVEMKVYSHEAACGEIARASFSSR
jgi:hypothetical protein